MSKQLQLKRLLMITYVSKACEDSHQHNKDDKTAYVTKINTVVYCRKDSYIKGGPCALGLSQLAEIGFEAAAVVNSYLCRH